jgi:acyl-CoA synthetase (AMP-forming)/AMP-acid ligase II
MSEQDTTEREQFSLAGVNEVVASVAPDREAVIFGDRRLTFGELAERSRRLASYLHGRGLGCHTERSELAPHESGQDHVGQYLYNGNEYLESMLGCFKSRVAPFNVNYRYVDEELRYLLNNAGAKGLIYHAEFAPTLARVLPELPELTVLIQVADHSGEPLLPGAVDYEEALAQGDPAGPPVEPSPDDLYILYTGGTTGMPKGVLWRQHDIFMNAMGGKEVGTWIEVSSSEEIAEKVANNAGFRLMTLPPLMHGAAQWAGFMMLNAGSTLIMPTSHHLDAAEVWSLIEREQAQSVTVVGDAMARPLLEEYKRGSYDAGALFVIGNGGAALSAAIKEEYLELLPNLLINDSLGSSETGAQASHLSAKDSVQTGKFNPGPGATVVSEDLTRVLEPGHEGIGWLAQSGAVPLGYLGDADKTARTFPTIEGVRYSVPGDRAIRKGETEIDLLGRDSQCINSGGEKIFVEEVEQAIISHPAVQDVLVAGRPSERWGSEVVAVVQLVDGGQVTEDELAAHANEHVARYKLPKAWVFVDQVVRSPSGKADYRWAKELATASGSD